MKKITFVLGLMMLLFTPLMAICDEIAPGAISYYNKGVEQYRQKAYGSALSSFLQATKIEPKFVDAYYNMASIYEMQQQYEKAMDAYSQVLKVNPNDYDAIYALAKICYKKGSYSTAVKYIKFLPQSYDNYGLAMKILDECESAIDAQKDRMSRTKINTANSNKRTIIDQFASPTGITMDSSGNLYVACYSDNSIMKVMPDKNTALFVKSPELNGPIGLAIDKFDNIYVANYENNNILKIAPNGRVFIFMDNINKPYYLFINNDTLYISEQSNNVVMKYQLE